MARKSKYGEETKLIGYRVPVSKEQDFRKLADDFLENISGKKEKDLSKSKPKEKTKEVIEKDKSFECGCVIENGLLRRIKNSNCKKTKNQH